MQEQPDPLIDAELSVSPRGEGLQWDLINLVLNFCPDLPTDVSEVPGLRGFIGLSLSWLEL